MMICQLTTLVPIIMFSSLILTSLPAAHAFRSSRSSLTAFASARRKITSPFYHMMYRPRIQQRHNLASLVCTSSCTNDDISELDENKGLRDSNETWQNPRSRWARRKHRKKLEKLQREGVSETETDEVDTLNWDKFEFGDR